MKFGPEMSLAASLALKNQFNGSTDPNLVVATELANQIINAPQSQALLHSYSSCGGLTVNLTLAKNSQKAKMR